MKNNNYSALVGVCFGSNCADVRQSVYVTFSSSCRTVRGFRNAALKAARECYPRYARLFSVDDCAIINLTSLADIQDLCEIPKGVYTFNGRCLVEGVLLTCMI